MEKLRQINVWYFIFAMFGIIWLREIWVEMQQVEPLPYSEFQNQLQGGNVEEIIIEDTYISGILKQPLQDGRQKFVTTRVDPVLAKDFTQYGVKFTGVIRSTLLRDILSWVVPAVIFLAIWIFLVRRVAEKQGMGGGFMAIGKSKAKIYVERDTKVTFQDVAGVDEAKEELQEVIGFLKEPGKYGKLGGRIPKGVLLIGPPGTGKTLLARAVAGESGVSFFSISGSEFVEMFVGVGAARVRDLFEQARQKAPAIIFIDELDSLGRARGAFPYGGHDEKEQTLNQLLAEMDGFDPTVGLVLIAATNRPEILDPALLRAGRFDRQVLVDRPDKKGRIEVLNLHLKNIKTAPDVDPEKIAGLTPGFSGADLANLVNESALLATRRDVEAVAMEDFTGAVERIVAGLEKKNRLLNPREREIVAYHEMGHALVAIALPETDPVHKVSIIPRGISALGYTIQRPTEDRFLMTRSELENKMAVLLGGRASEHIIFAHISTGAADDLGKATDIARSMVTRFGMYEKLGNVAYEDERHSFPEPAMAAYQQKRFSEETAREIDCAVRDLIEDSFRKATAILVQNQATLEEYAKKLLQHETLSETELRVIKENIKQHAEGAAALVQQHPS